MAETITVTTPADTITGDPLDVAGTYTEGPPTALDFRFDGTGDWTAADSPVIGGGNFSFTVPFASTGPIAEATINDATFVGGAGYGLVADVGFTLEIAGGDGTATATVTSVSKRYAVVSVSTPDFNPDHPQWVVAGDAVADFTGHYFRWTDSPGVLPFDARWFAAGDPTFDGTNTTINSFFAVGGGAHDTGSTGYLIVDSSVITGIALDVPGDDYELASGVQAVVVPGTGSYIRVDITKLVPLAPLSVGTHTIEVRDHDNTGVSGTSADFTIQDVPTITVDTPATAVQRTPMAIAGEYTGRTPAALDYRIDGGSWVAADAPDILAGLFGFDITAPDAGDHTIDVRDHDHTDVLGGVDFSTRNAVGSGGRSSSFGFGFG